MARVGLIKSSAQALLNEYKNEIGSVIESEQNSFELIQDKLENKLKEVELLTKNCFKALGYDGVDIQSDEKELQKNVKEAMQTVTNLSGDSLGNEFIQRLIDTNPFEYDNQRLFNVLINYIEYISDFGYSDYDFVKKFSEEVLGEFLSWDSMTGLIRSRSGRFLGNFSQIYSELGKETKKSVNKFMKENQDFKEFDFYSNEQFRKGKEDMEYTIELTFKANLLEAFLKMNPTQRQELFESHESILVKINEEYTNFILDKCQVNGEDRTLLKQCIDIVLEKNQLAFFIGKNTEQLTGILGEIQGLYIFKKIIKKNNSTANVDWVGGVRNPHADLLLKSTLGNFGIQIKNTSYDRAAGELYNIEFKELNLSSRKRNQVENNVFSTTATLPAYKYAANLGLTTEVFDAIQDALAAKTFNIQYMWNKSLKQAEEVSYNPDFIDVREEIEHYALQAEAIMGIFSVALMYMQTIELNDKSKSKDYANTFYLIGGATIMSAATILAEIVKEVKSIIKQELDHFSHLQIYVKSGHEQQKTIVDFFNNNKKREHHSDIMSFTLQSSYNF